MTQSYFIHPKQNFLQTLANFLAKKNFTESIVILPSRRAGLFLRYYLAQNLKKTFLAPTIFSLEDFIYLQFLQKFPYSLLTNYDFISLTYPYFSSFLSLENYLSWYSFVYELLDELDKELIKPINIALPLQENSCTQYLLTNLEEIQKKFHEDLHKHKLTTSGFCFRTLAKELELLKPSHPVYLAGFFALTKSERIIFNHLKKAGACFFFEEDPQKINPLLQKELQALNLEPIPLEVKEFKAPRFKFYFTQNYHLTLEELKQNLPQNILAPDQVAILTPNTELIKPLMLLLKDQKVNFTLGYSLKYTAIFSFLNILKELADNYVENKIYIPAFLSLLKHPYLSQIKIKDQSIAEYIYQLDLELTQNYKLYLSLEEILNTTNNHRIKDLLLELYTHLELAFKEPRPLYLKEGVNFFYKCINFILQHQKELSSEENTEGRVIFTWREEVLNKLKFSSLSQHSFSWPTFLSFLLETTAKIYLPLKGEPLAGIQVLGLLESRLLCFKQVFVLGAEEGNLPAPANLNPLLSPEIRNALGLAQREKPEHIQAYHFFRLVKASEETYLFVTNSEKKDFWGNKGLTSRFVEQILWELENKKEEINIYQPSLTLSPKLFTTTNTLIRDSLLKEKIQEIFKQGLSPSLLNTYLNCEIKFYFTYLLKIKEEINLGDFPAHLFGKVIHDILYELFLPFQNKNITQFDLDKVKETIKKHFTNSSLVEKLDEEKKLFLEHISYLRIKDYLNFFEKNLSQAKIFALEKSIQGTYNGIKLLGRIDKILQKENKLIILDYKTGTKLPSLRKVLTGLEEASSLEDLRRNNFDFQIPFYLFLVASNYQDYLLNGGYVALGLLEAKQKLNLLFSKDLAAANQKLLTNFPVLLELISQDILEKEEFSPTLEARNCTYCTYQKICPQPLL